MITYQNKGRSKYNRRAGRLVLVIDRNALVVGAALAFATAFIMG